MAGFWDDPDVKVTSEWFKFDEVGDSVEGHIAKLGKKVWTDGSIGIEIHFVEEDSPTVTASQTLLKQALFELKPTSGDQLKIALAGIEKRPGGKTLKRFKVGILRAEDGSRQVIDQVNPDNSTVIGAPGDEAPIQGSAEKKARLPKVPAVESPTF